jgi:hypothetical protein
MRLSFDYLKIKRRSSFEWLSLKRLHTYDRNARKLGVAAQVFSDSALRAQDEHRVSPGDCDVGRTPPTIDVLSFSMIRRA